MRDFSWKYFAMTGDVDAYLFYRETEAPAGDQGVLEDEEPEYEEEAQ